MTGDGSELDPDRWIGLARASSDAAVERAVLDLFESDEPVATPARLRSLVEVAAASRARIDRAASLGGEQGLALLELAADVARRLREGDDLEVVVVDDGNGYHSVYTELKDLLVKPGDKVKAGQPIGHMSVAEKKYMMRYRLVRMDGPLMKVHDSAR